MKRFTKNFFGVALAAGLVWPHATPLAAQTNDQPDAVATNADTEITATNTSSTGTEKPASNRRRGPVVAIGGSSTTAAGEAAEVVVSIGGSSTAGGKVQDAVDAPGRYRGCRPANRGSGR